MTEAAEIIARHCPGWRPRLGLMLGSGLSGLAARVEQAVEIPYRALPGFPEPTVAGHEGTLVCGTLAGTPALCFKGRVHAYEGGDPGASIRTMVRTLRRLGGETLLLTNAAGSLRPEIGPGSLVAITDHINLMGFNPLTGPNDEAIGPRFPSLRDAYDPDLRASLARAAEAEEITLSEGIYLACPGPSFETPAEIRAFRTLGADLVGMSTVPEVIVARHCGLRVAAISVVTNLAEGMEHASPSHAETLAVAALAAGRLESLVMGFAAHV
ncbi:MAG TPA: purine-nucleoside phosphorylase [Aliidongia sp.]|nr:purine-nucleoside phosphorylase [Aliidongia sp.]